MTLKIFKSYHFSFNFNINFLSLSDRFDIMSPIISFVLGVVISLVYKKTHKGLSYSQSFMVTNIFVAVIVCMVIMIIGNNLARAFALVGALSIISGDLLEKISTMSPFSIWIG